jgi:hypothetical protein
MNMVCALPWSSFSTANTSFIVELAAFLGVASPESNRLYNRADIPRRGDGFISPELRVPARCSPELRTILQAFEGKSFHASPIRGLKVLIGLRRYGLEYFKTDVGQILAGRQLSKTDFAGRSGSGGPGGGDGGDDDDDDDDHPGGPPDDMDLDVPPPLAGGDDPPGVPVEPGPGPRPPSPPEGQDMLNAPALEIAHAQHVNAAIKEEAADDLLVEERPDNTQPVKQEDEDDEIEIIDRPPAAIKDEDDDDIIMVKDEDDDVAVVVKNEGDLDLDAQITAAEVSPILPSHLYTQAHSTTGQSRSSSTSPRDPPSQARGGAATGFSRRHIPAGRTHRHDRPVTALLFMMLYFTRVQGSEYVM